jgi:SAM-dependent methyltransferase
MQSPTTPWQPGADSEWFAAWFDSVHYHRLYAHRDATEAADLVDALVDRLAPQPHAAILDLGCGSGRHARRLAAHGFEVTGIDLSAASLARARRRRGAPVRFVQQDMRQPFGTRAFDCVVSLFTSFGYFADPADHHAVVGNIARALRPGGRVVLDYLNVARVEARLVREEIAERAGIVYRVSRWSDAAAIHKRIVVDDPAAPAPLSFVERVAKLAPRDFARLFTRAGLVVEALFGDYALGAFDVNVSPRLILVARKGDGWADALAA